MIPFFKVHRSLLAAVWCIPLNAAVIVNGGFESGFSGWTRADQIGSEGGFVLQSGTTSPVNSVPVPAPPGGQAAMTDAQGPGSHVLYQVFTVTAPLGPTALVFDLFIGNRADEFRTPTTLDFATPVLNQQARVDILAGTADPFSTASTDILLNLFRTAVGSPLVSGYTHYSVDVTPFLNTNLNRPLMLRFAEVDNVNMFQFGVDDVDLAAAAAVPEPATSGLVLAALTASELVRRYVSRRR